MVMGASSGFGYAISKALVNEGALVTINAREGKKLNQAEKQLGSNVSTISGDVTKDQTLQNIADEMQQRRYHGMLVNTGGPPATGFEGSILPGWDEAYLHVLRWKVDLMLRVVPIFKKHGYGRILFLESASVKQPVENLVYSNSFRMAVVGFVKTLANEIAGSGVNLNIIAPGFHRTSAVERIIKKKCETEGISYDEARKKMEDSIPLKITGNPEEFARLALWLLSPSSEFVSGQIFYVDGGSIKATL
jgi:3-oxoacyl-[acyl-carrier protein] reductase